MTDFKKIATSLTMAALAMVETNCAARPHYRLTAHTITVETDGVALTCYRDGTGGSSLSKDGSQVRWVNYQDGITLMRYAGKNTGTTDIEISADQGSVYRLKNDGSLDEIGSAQKKQSFLESRAFAEDACTDGFSYFGLKNHGPAF